MIELTEYELGILDYYLNLPCNESTEDRAKGYAEQYELEQIQSQEGFN